MKEVDISTTWYRVNVGIKNFAMLIKRYNLFTGNKQALIDEIVTNIK